MSPVRRHLLVLTATAALVAALLGFGSGATATAAVDDTRSASSRDTCTSWGIRSATYVKKVGTRDNYGAVHLLRRTCRNVDGYYKQYLARGFAYWEPTLPSNVRLVAGLRNQNSSLDRWCASRTKPMCTTAGRTGSCKRATAAIQRWNSSTRKWVIIGWGATRWFDC